jgi:hypothetical protein
MAVVACPAGEVPATPYKELGYADMNTACVKQNVHDQKELVRNLLIAQMTLLKLTKDVDYYAYLRVVPKKVADDIRAGNPAPSCSCMCGCS